MKILKSSILFLPILFATHASAYLDLFTNMGEIYRTSSGSSWQLIANVGYTNGVSYKAVQGNVSYFLTENGIILRSTDNGHSWTGISAYPVSDAVDLLYSAIEGKYFLLTQSGDLYRGGQINSMSLVANLGGNGLIAIVQEKRSGGGIGFYFAVTQMGDVYRSQDGGSTWSLVGNVGTTDVVALTAQTDTLQVMTHEGDLYRSTDRGATWTLWSTVSQVGAVALAADQNDVLFLALETGEVAEYTSGAWHWIGTISQVGVRGITTSVGSPTLGNEGESHEIERLQVMPNPTTHRVWVLVPPWMEGKLWQLLSLEGRFLQGGILGGGRESLDLENLRAGVYLLKVGPWTTKVVKQ